MSRSSGPDCKRRKLDRDPLKEAGSARLYEYRKIEGDNEIRLIALLPGSFHSKIRCEFIISDLEDPPDYEALSYTWADWDDDQVLNGTVWCEPGDRMILVTRNCEDALRRLRLHHEPRFLWVDAVCINQAFIQERNQQVALMPKIYRSASRVTVYLGEVNADTEKFLDFLDGLPLDVEAAPNVYILLAKSLFGRRWFERLWILQEIALARAASVICGNKTISWQKLADYYRDTFSKSSHMSQFPHLKAVFDCGLQGARPMKTLPELFAESHLRSCSDPRDRVFALFGILHEDLPLALAPEYGASNRDIFTELATYFLKEFNLLFVHERFKQRQKDWPSWVFDWSRPCTQPNYPLTIDKVVSFSETMNGRRVLKILGRRVINGTVCKGYHPDGRSKVGWDCVTVKNGLTRLISLLHITFPDLSSGPIPEALRDVIAVEVSQNFFVLLLQKNDHCRLLGGVADFQRCQEVYPSEVHVHLREKFWEVRTKVHNEPGTCTSTCSRPGLKLEQPRSFIIL